MSLLDHARKGLELDEAATKGPWRATEPREGAFGLMFSQVMEEERPGYLWGINGLGGGMQPENASFIAHARNHYADLCRALVETAEALRGLDKALATLFWTSGVSPSSEYVLHSWKIARNALAALNKP